MWCRTFILVCCLLTPMTACRRDHENIRIAIPPGISWASLLSDAADLRTLASPVGTDISKMFSSSSDTGKVVLAHLSPEIYGDMDHGFFKDVIEGPDGVKATLAEFAGPGVVTWVWSANPRGILHLFIDDMEHSALSMPLRSAMRRIAA